MARTIFATCSVHVLLIALLAVVVAAAADEDKPIFHLRPPANWINDPNGPFHDPITKVMHLFMQYNPNDAVWGSINWYHFTSDDYVTWQDKGIALKNDQDYDHWGAYSGSITQNEDGTPVMMYTCTADGDVQKQCIAVPPSADIQGPDAPRTLNSWVKSPQNPVLSADDVPNLVGQNNFRDPTNFWQNPKNPSEWLVAFAARMNRTEEGDVAHVVVFKTSDKTLQSGFTYSHSMWHDPYDPNHMVECPDVFALGSRHVMKVSTMISQQDLWMYGSFAEDPKNPANYIFVEDPSFPPAYIDHGRWYASKHNYDPVQNRTILWGWIVEDFEGDASQQNAAMRAQGWSGVMDMPRVVEYDNNYQQLKTNPIPELSTLREAPLVNQLSLSLNGNESAVVTTSAGRHYELIVDFELPEGALEDETLDDSTPTIGVDVLGSADGTQYTRIAAGSGIDVNGRKVSGKIYRLFNVDFEGDCMDECSHNPFRCMGYTFHETSAPNCALMSTMTVLQAEEDEAKTSHRNVGFKMFFVDRTKSGTTGSTETWMGTTAMHTLPKVQFRIFVDGSVVQVFKDGGLESLSTRVYNTSSLPRISAFASNIKGTVKVTATLYPMKTIYAPESPETAAPETTPPETAAPETAAPSPGSSEPGKSSASVNGGVLLALTIAAFTLL